jgi:TonB family protein
VTDVTIAKSSGFPRLDEATISCVGRWKYKAATQDGNPVTMAWQANVQWKLH